MALPRPGKPPDPDLSQKPAKFHPLFANLAKSIKIPSLPPLPPLLRPPLANPMIKNLPSMTATPSLITPDLVDTTGFIKYSKLSLSAADDILPFYQNMYAQGLQYNMVLLPCDNILPDCGIYHPDLSTDTIAVIDTTIGTKLR